MTPVLLDSITDARETHRDRVGISGSHGGLYAAACASRAGLRAVVLNDAGRGLDDAGVAGVAALDRVAMAGATVSFRSAEIGSARESLDCGMLSYVNRTAHALGLREGLPAAAAVAYLTRADLPEGMLDKVEEARWDEPMGDAPAVLCADSAALITPADEGRIIVTGSHGGLVGGDPARACKARARLVAFNDAGGGKNGIGLSRLPALEEQGVAAVTLDCFSCRIGEARSGLETGIVSHANGPAQDMGLSAGHCLKPQLRRLR